MTPPLAHGIGAVQDLPVPLWLFYYGAAVVLILSFIALGVLWRKPRLEAAAGGSPLPETLQRVVLSPVLRLVLGVLGFGLFVVVFLAAAFGENSPGINLAPTFIYVVFWLGLVPIVVLLGNVWAALNPWRAAADAVAWLWNRTGGSWEPPFSYSERLGRWPATAGLYAFAALELAYFDQSSPRALAVAIALYSWVTWLGMAAFGRDAWTANGEAFSVYFGFLARISPFAVSVRPVHGRTGHRGLTPDASDSDLAGERVVVVRPPLSGLTVRDARPGTLAFVAVMLGSVAFDGISRSSWYQNRKASIISPLDISSIDLANLVDTLYNAVGLLIAVGVVALAYLAAVEAARTLAGGDTGRLAGAFLASLIPIALAYAVAHYFTLLLNQGQFAIPLASDPFGWGWDVFGTSDYRPNLSLLSANTVWYTQVGALVVGHVLGLALAHDRAVSMFRSPGTALRTQYAMLLLMVVYTVGGLWMLSSG